MVKVVNVLYLNAAIVQLMEVNVMPVTLTIIEILLIHNVFYAQLIIVKLVQMEHLLLVQSVRMVTK